VTPPRVRSMTMSDVEDVVRVHMEAFPGFFLAFLGRGFLREVYREIVSDPAGIAFVAEHNDVIGGFVAGTAEPRGFYSRLMRKRALKLGFHAAMAVLRRPAVAPRLLRGLRRPKEVAHAGAKAELTSLAVLPAARRSGSGALLVHRFVSRAAELGVSSVLLVTDADGNEGVNEFYVRCGFARSRTYTTPEGRRMNEYEKAIGGPEGRPDGSK
jgi:ribosomal protein S18 acetylase RimI-like enzyme